MKLTLQQKYYLGHYLNANEINDLEQNRLHIKDVLGDLTYEEFKALFLDDLFEVEICTDCKQEWETFKGLNTCHYCGSEHFEDGCIDINDNIYDNNRDYILPIKGN
jgi:hypothetical protein